MTPQKNPDLLLDENLNRIKRKIVVMSGKGGVGKSTVSVNLAYGLLSEGYRVGLLDVDIHGPSLAKMTGIEGAALIPDEQGIARPISAFGGLFVLSMASMLQNADDAVIWRGPAKMGAIRQFLQDIEWPELDFLIVDCPPGTGDEPLSVIQLLKKVDGAVLVTTPQQVSMLDVRKSVSFAKTMGVPILGIVENMSGFICPDCHKRIDIFKTGAADKICQDFNLPLLGKIPLESEIVHASDQGIPYILESKNNPGGQVFRLITSKISESFQAGTPYKKGETMKEKIALPIDKEAVSAHFGHAEQFVLYDLDDKKIVGTKKETPPPHEPGTIPRWLHALGATTVITGGMGQKAISLFQESGITVLSAPSGSAHSQVINDYLAGKLGTPAGGCKGHSHDHESCH